MKRILFYGLLIMQIVIISLIAWQDHLMERYGDEIIVRSAHTHTEYGWIDHQDNLRIITEITKIPRDKWDENVELIDWDELIYVLLEKDEEGFYVVSKASTKKLKAEGNQVVLSGQFMWWDPKSTEVDLGISKARPHLHADINERRPFSITIKVAPWGQRKIVKLEQ